MRAAASPVIALTLLLGASARAHPDGMSAREKAHHRQELERAAEREDWRGVHEAMHELQRANDLPTWELLVRVAERAPPDSDCARALGLAATGMTDERVQQAVTRVAVRSRSTAVRRQLVGHVVTKGDHATLTALLDDADEVVAARAAWALVDARVESAVEPMLALMERLEGDRAGIWDVLHDALAEALGPGPATAAEYRAGWEALKAAGGLAALPPRAEEPVEVQPDERPDAGPQLFGRSVQATRIVLIVDVSESMAMIDPGPVDPAGPAAAPPSRLQRVQLGLRRFIAALPASAQLNIVMYSNQAQLWRGGVDLEPPRLHAMTDRNKRDACEFIDRFMPDGTSRLDEALMRAFEIENGRCVLLLGDGVATHDGTTPLDTPTLTRVVDEYGKDRRVPIHTFGFAGGRKELLLELAGRTRGRYSVIP